MRALTFLETALLVEVDGATARINITPKGKFVADQAQIGESDLAHTLHVIERSYRNLSVEKQISLGLE